MADGSGRDLMMPERYSLMCRAIDDCYEVDEAKEIRDQAVMLETYSRQAQNTEAERRACEVRLRAERKAGELLREQEKNAGGRPSETGNIVAPVSDAPTLRDLGISKRQSSDWQRLAAVPKEQFDAALADPSQKPTTAGILKAADPARAAVAAVSNDALWLWGRLCEFERRGILSSPPAAIALTMTPEMLNDLHRLAPLVGRWLKQIGVP